LPGSMPATSQLEWLISTTAMIVLSWSRGTRDLLRSFGWGIAALHRKNAATKLPCLAARPIASIGPAPLMRYKNRVNLTRQQHCLRISITLGDNDGKGSRCRIFSLARRVWRRSGTKHRKSPGQARNGAARMGVWHEDFP